MTEARGHHYVSQCYLKRFTHDGSKNSKLFVLDLASGRRFASAPKNVAKQRDFNTIEGRPAGELENRLAGFETEVNKALDVIAQSRTMDDRDAWMHVMNLAAMFAVRNPRMRGGMERFQAQIAKVTMSMVLSSREMYESQMKQARAAGHVAPESKATYEEVREFFERGEYTINVANASHIFNEFGVFEDVLRTLVARKWALCVAPADSGGFITSDHPICLMSSDGSPSELRRPVAHGLMETTVLFPIARSRRDGHLRERGSGRHALSRGSRSDEWLRRAPCGAASLRGRRQVSRERNGRRFHAGIRGRVGASERAQ